MRNGTSGKKLSLVFDGLQTNLLMLSEKFDLKIMKIFFLETVMLYIILS